MLCKSDKPSIIIIIITLTWSLCYCQTLWITISICYLPGHLLLKLVLLAQQEVAACECTAQTPDGKRERGQAGDREVFATVVHKNAT